MPLHRTETEVDFLQCLRKDTSVSMYSRVTPVEQVECEFEVGSHSVEPGCHTMLCLPPFGS